MCIGGIATELYYISIRQKPPTVVIQRVANGVDITINFYSSTPLLPKLKDKRTILVLGTDRCLLSERLYLYLYYHKEETRP